MCPPPSEPIRPVGPLAGDVYVERSAFADRVARRRRRADEDRKRQHDGSGREQDEDEPEVPASWFRSEAPLKAAGGYDDHGRIASPADDADAARPHVDRTA